MVTSFSRKIPSFRILSFILVFLYSGAIVGETVALSLVVSIAGSAILSKLYLINGMLLFLLPLLFFNNIDRINRARLLSLLLLFTTAALAGIMIVFAAKDHVPGLMFSLMLWIIYPLSYLSKTVLFLTFWTLANDICLRGEAKSAFPKMAAWGFIGGLGGAWASKILLEIADPKAVILIWALAYLIAFAFSLQVGRLHRLRLLQKERDPKSTSRSLNSVLGDVKDVLAIDLVRLISILYFLIFLAIFSLDYLFWHTCHLWFSTAHQLASFQYSFFIAHSVFTIFSLQYAMPVFIRRWGFPRIFALLPLVMLSGSLLLMFASLFPLSGRVIFAGLIVFQFARYIAFENAFSPVYQMFFASISKEKRGRAKTILEGVIKPSAIISAGLLLMVIGRQPGVILASIAVSSGVMIWIARRVRQTYVKGLIPELSTSEDSSDIIAEIGSHYDLKILSLIKEYSRSQDADLRGVAVKILAHLGSREALKIVAEIYRREKLDSVKEMVARSLTNFYWHEAKTLVEALLKDANPRIRSNAVHSLNEMNSNWKWRLKDKILDLLSDKSIRVRIEAAQFLWQAPDRPERERIAKFIDDLVNSANTNKRSAGLYLIGQLKPPGWENLLRENLKSGSYQVYEKCIDVIFASASNATRIEVLRTVQSMSREQIARLGRIVLKNGPAAKETICAYLKDAGSRRLVFELVHALRLIYDGEGPRKKEKYLDKTTEDALEKWIGDELESAYRDAAVWNDIRQKRKADARNSWMLLLDDALRERMNRIVEWALDALVLLERRHGIRWAKQEFDIKEYADRMDLVEILENFSPNRITACIVPILRGDSWEKIAKTGRQQFNFSTDIVQGGLRYYISSQNKWICLCALYCLWRMDDIESLRAAEGGALRALANEPSIFVAAAAQHLLGVMHTDGEKVRNTFGLLETVLFLKKTLLFRNVPAEKLIGLAEISQLASYEKDTVISQEGDISDHLYVVKSGSLKIVKEKNHVRTILAIIRQGEAYGEIGLLNQAPRSASAIANENCEAYVVQRRSLKKLLMEMPEIAYNFLEIFSEKLRRSGEEVALLQTTLSDRIVQNAQTGNI